jgi:hypothetical protein
MRIRRAWLRHDGDQVRRSSFIELLVRVEANPSRDGTMALCAFDPSAASSQRFTSGHNLDDPLYSAKALGSHYPLGVAVKRKRPENRSGRLHRQIVFLSDGSLRGASIILIG